MSNCQIIRDESANAALKFNNESVDYLYIDGNHRYDYVLSDLVAWEPKISSMGAIVLNDVYVSHIAKKQHLSVLEAVSTFIKLFDWVPIAVVNREFTDCILVRENKVNDYKRVLVETFWRNQVGFIEVSESQFHSMHHKQIIINGSFAGEFLSFK